MKKKKMRKMVKKRKKNQKKIPLNAMFLLIPIMRKKSLKKIRREAMTLPQIKGKTLRAKRILLVKTLKRTRRTMELKERKKATIILKRSKVVHQRRRKELKLLNLLLLF